MQSTTSHPLSVKCILKLSHLHRGLLSGLFIPLPAVRETVENMFDDWTLPNVAVGFQGLV
jgi:hypothetical protein